MTDQVMSINADVAHRLGNYVYALVDPRDGIPFYIGKGTSARVEHHGLEAKAWVAAENPAGLNEKLDRISAIEDSGGEVDIWILRYGMTRAEYSAVESTLIDFVRTFPVASSPERIRPLTSGTPLTNKVRGGDAAQGITRLGDIVDELRAPALISQHPLLLITLGDWKDAEQQMPNGQIRSGFGFKNEWMDKKLLESSIDELANSTCCWWRWDQRKVENSGITHLVAVYRGVTRGLFQIVPGTFREIYDAPHYRRGCDVIPVVDRADPLWREVVGPHGHSIPAKKRGDRGSFRYWPYAT